MDRSVGILADADIEIRDGAIVHIGGSLVAPGAAVIDGSAMITLPGFIDTHWHVWGTLLRGLIGDGPQRGWFAMKYRYGSHLTPQDVYTGARLGMVEGLSAGITTVHDWAHNIMRYEDATENIRVHRELGTRVHFSYSAPSGHPSMPIEKMRDILEKGGVLPDDVMDFANVERIRDEIVPSSEGLLSVGVALRGPARSTPDVYHQEWRLARDLGLTISMHCAGTRGEVARIRQVEILNDEGLLGRDILLAHCLYISAKERTLLAEHDIPISVSPMSELRLAMGIPPILEHIAAGVSVSLSLDTTAISANADPFQAMKIAVGLEAARTGDAEALPPHRALELATIEGARALGIDATTGSLTPGKRADIIMVRADHPNVAPMVDPAVAIVHSVQPANVDTVIVDGRILKRGGVLIGVDSGTVVAEAEEALRRLQEREAAA